MADIVRPLTQLLDLQAFLEKSIPTSEDTDTDPREAINEACGQVWKILQAASLAGRSLKKGSTDVKSALQAHKTSETLRAKHAGSDRSSGKKGKMSGYAATSDPAAAWPHCRTRACVCVCMCVCFFPAAWGRAAVRALRSSSYIRPGEQITHGDQEGLRRHPCWQQSWDSTLHPSKGEERDEESLQGGVLPDRSSDWGRQAERNLAKQRERCENAGGICISAGKQSSARDPESHPR